MPVLHAQVRGCARLLALAAFLGALVAGLLGRGLRLGRLGSRCRGDWILRFGMERGAVLVVAGVAAPAERESSGCSSAAPRVVIAAFVIRRHPSRHRAYRWSSSPGGPTSSSSSRPGS